jgi:hypothetical protein
MFAVFDISITTAAVRPITTTFLKCAVVHSYRLIAVVSVAVKVPHSDIAFVFEGECEFLLSEVTVVLRIWFRTVQSLMDGDRDCLCGSFG